MQGQGEVARPKMSYPSTYQIGTDGRFVLFEAKHARQNLTQNILLVNRKINLLQDSTITRIRELNKLTQTIKLLLI